MQQNSNPVPEFYADAFQVTVSPFGVNMTFSLRDPHPSAGKLVPGTDMARVRMSPEHAKIMAMMLIRQIRNYERDSGIKIAIPAQVYTQLGIAEEDWEV
jgi:hypothetical protein